MAIAVVGSSICTFLRLYNFLEIACRCSWMIKYDLFNSLIHKDITFYDNNKTGELLSRMDSDTEIIQAALSFQVSMAVQAVIQISLTFTIMMLINWKVTLCALGGIMPIFIMTKFLVKYYMLYSK